MSDYKRIPVASFGLALLKGMGWKEGSAASRTRTGLVEPYNPAPRPAMLGIGAKERIVPEGEELKGKKKWKAKEEARKYIPVVRKDGVSSWFAVSNPGGYRSFTFTDLVAVFFNVLFTGICDLHTFWLSSPFSPEFSISFATSAQRLVKKQWAV
jgi:hypothetical protein